MYTRPVGQSSPSEGPIRRAPGLDFIQTVCVCVAVFTLVAFNSNPFILSSGIAWAALAAVLFVHTLIKAGGMISIAPMTRPAVAIFALWMFLALVSAIASREAEAMLNWVWGHLVPFMMLLSLAALKMRSRDLEYVIAALALGLILRFGVAAAVYVATMGVSSISAAFDARYNVVAMQPYMDMTFGNTGNTGSVIAISFVILATSFMVQGLRPWIRLLVTGALILMAVNVLMTGSRGAILTMLACLALAALIVKSRWRYVMIAGAIPSVLYAGWSAGNMIISRFSSVIAVDYIADRSIRERLDSIGIGIDLMLHNPLGVGPGMSYIHNAYSVAHQFAISQGSELGVAGLLLTIALAALITVKVVRARREALTAPAMAFRMGALAWLVYGMTTNLPVNAGASIPWIGLLAISLAFGDFVDQGGGARPVPAKKGRGRPLARPAQGLIQARPVLQPRR